MIKQQRDPSTSSPPKVYVLRFMSLEVWSYLKSHPWASVGTKIIISFFSDIDGNEISLEKYRGHVCIIVNVASKWGKTDVNYKQLVEMHKTFSEGKYWMIKSHTLPIYKYYSNNALQCSIFIYLSWRFTYPGVSLQSIWLPRTGHKWRHQKLCHLKIQCWVRHVRKDQCKWKRCASFV